MAWPLLACSLLALTIILERTVFYIAMQSRKNNVWVELSTQLIHHQHRDKVWRDETITLALTELQCTYYRGLRLLRFIGTLSPLLGLLGTILGIIQIFRVIAAHTGSISPSLIASGLWEALLTTAVGLIIALPALLMTHIFQAIADRQLRDLGTRLNALSLSFATPTAAGNRDRASSDTSSSLSFATPTAAGDREPAQHDKKQNPP